MKTKLLLHIGYPKTATTTLQEGLFINLHKQGLINYLGMDLHNKNMQFNEYKKLNSFLYYDKNFSFNDLHLSRDKMNVISDEVLTFPYYYRKKMRKFIKSDSLNFPEKLNLISKNCDIEFLVTIRNQSDLMYSLYSQCYLKLFRNDKSQDTPSKHFFDKNNEVKEYIFDIYNFNYLTSKYEKYFGQEKIHIALFEDMIYQQEEYFSKIGESLNIDEDIIKNSFINVHYRDKKEERDKKFEKYYQETVIMRIISKLFNNNQNKYLSHIESTLKKKKVFSKKNKILYKKKYIEVPKLTDADRYVIRRHFNQSNLSVLEKYGLNFDSFKKYKYIISES